jgi:predicted permease
VARGVVVAQVAVTMALVTAASLLTVTLNNVSRVDGGFAVDHRLMLRLEARSTRWEQAGLQPIMPEILRRVRMVPGVLGAASSTRLPLYGGSMSPTDVRVPGYVEPTAPPTAMGGMSGMAGMSMASGPTAAFIGADPGYFAAAGVRLVSGREFTDADRAGAEPVAIVSTTFQRQYFQGRDALGEAFGVRLGSDTAFTNVRIVGVAGDVKYGSLRETPQPYFYVPFVQAPGSWTRTVMVVRTEGDPMRLTQAVTQAVDAAAPGLNALGALDMVTTRNDALTMERMSAELGGFISTMALLLSAVGLYGVIAYSVSRRTSEIGVRLALGAPAQSVLWLIGRETALLVGVGLAVGIPLSFATDAGIRAPLYGVGMFDPRSFVVAIVLLALAGMAASVIPARRAARIDPKVALNAE